MHCKRRRSALAKQQNKGMSRTVDVKHVRNIKRARDGPAHSTDGDRDDCQREATAASTTGVLRCVKLISDHRGDLDCDSGPSGDTRHHNDADSIPRPARSSSTSFVAQRHGDGQHGEQWGRDAYEGT